MEHTNDNNGFSPLNSIIRFFLHNKLITALCAAGIVAWGIMVAPFDWDLSFLPRDPVAVDAIPNTGKNQQIVFTRWKGRSPQDIEDQITYPLTVSLMGIPGVSTVRSFSMFGFSSIYVVFKDKVDFYWSRSRIMEKLSSLPPATLPDGVKPSMGPDATALGQIFWYTLEGRDPHGNPTGGWGLDTLRSIQDWYVRYALMSADGVAEVASAGGYVQEYQVDVDPDAMHAHNVTLPQIYDAVRTTNLDAGARTIELNNVEYVIRGIGSVEKIADIEKTVVRERDNVAITIADVATVHRGPAPRRGVLDKGGAEAVGGVVVARYGENPLEVINNVKRRIQEIEPGLPSKTLENGTKSSVRIVPFYDRTDLIKETLGTLNTAISLEILITILVVLIMINNVRSSLVISSILPIAVLMSFIGMKLFGITANIVSLSGIAIAIGTIVDMGVVLSENVLRHISRAPPEEDTKTVVYRATTEIGGAIFTAVLTTIISFIPVFTMQAAEGKLFKPLAYTKTFALIASIIVALTLLPAILHMVYRPRTKPKRRVFTHAGSVIALCAGIVVMLLVTWWLGLIIITMAARPLIGILLPRKWHTTVPLVVNGAIIGIVALLLAGQWLPLGAETGYVKNLLFVILCVGLLLLAFKYLVIVYPRLLGYFLSHKPRFLVPVGAMVCISVFIWLGFSTVFFFLPDRVMKSPPVATLAEVFPGLGKEFMPPLDEGSYLYMPTTMTHASVGTVHDILRKQDMAIAAIPEVKNAVGKLGRAQTPLDPAPVSMIETIINIKSEFITDEQGRRKRFKYNAGTDTFVRDSRGELVADPRGRPYRQWREHIHHADDIWEEIVDKAQIPGVTSAPRLQPIAARIVMLQSGMRAPMGIKIHGQDLEAIERFGMQLETILKQVPSIKAASVNADRIIGKPYLEIEIDRSAIARYGLSIQKVQHIISVALGGKKITTTVEGRERYTVRVRYPRELRGLGGGIDEIEDVLVPSSHGTHIPLGEVARIIYRRGPQVIKSEDTFLTGYVIFDKKQGHAEVDVVQHAQQLLQDEIESGSLQVPPGISYAFAGSYKNQLRAEKRLSVIVPVALLLIFVILYFQFKRTSTTMLVFTGILVAWSGGFILLWLYGQDWFLDFSLFGRNLRDLFQIHTVNLSVAVWVGFLALFGIASDNGVVICTYLDQRFSGQRPQSIKEIRSLAIHAATQRVRPALMTSATTILALLPILSSTGRGADVMVPMAIPSFGGMLLQVVTIFITPVLYCWRKEYAFTKQRTGSLPDMH